jgi:predicted transglutaminase-like cysteine proteinase
MNMAAVRYWGVAATEIVDDDLADGAACGSSSTSVRWLERAGLFTVSGGMAAGSSVTPSAGAPVSHPMRIVHRGDQARLVERINLTVNRGTAQRSDRDTYTVDELWYPSGTGRKAAGDCEDLALEKKLRLIEAGFPADRLMLAVVYSREAGLHTILVARLPRADVVLDSRRDRIVRWSAAAYRWLSVQSPDSPRQWHAVQL